MRRWDGAMSGCWETRHLLICPERQRPRDAVLLGDGRSDTGLFAHCTHMVQTYVKETSIYNRLKKPNKQGRNILKRRMKARMPGVSVQNQIPELRGCGGGSGVKGHPLLRPSLRPVQALWDPASSNQQPLLQNPNKHKPMSPQTNKHHKKQREKGARVAFHLAECLPGMREIQSNRAPENESAGVHM